MKTKAITITDRHWLLANQHIKETGETFSQYIGRLIAQEQAELEVLEYIDVDVDDISEEDFELG